MFPTDDYAIARLIDDGCPHAPDAETDPAPPAPPSHWCLDLGD